MNTAEDFLGDLSQSVAASRLDGNTSLGQSRHVTTGIASRLKKIVRSGTSKPPEEPAVPVARLLTLDNMGELEDVFKRDGGRNTRVIRASDFVDAVVRLIESNAGETRYASREGLVLAVRRWCVAFARPQEQKTKHGGRIVVVRRTDAAAGISLSSQDLADPRSLAPLAIAWTDFTNHMLEYGQQRALAEESSASYKRVPREQLRSAPAAAATGTAPSGGDANERGYPSQRPRRRYFEHTEEAHDIAPSIAISSARRHTLLTGGRDGVVKEWDLATGNFTRNLYNAGRGWIVGMHFIGGLDHTLLVATSTSRLAIAHVSSDQSGVVRELAGTSDAKNVLHSSTLKSTTHTQRFGFKPGDKGLSKPSVSLRDDETSQRDFIDTWREAVAGAPTRTVPVAPIVGMQEMSAFWHMGDGQCAYGSSEGRVGFFDVSNHLDHFAAPAEEDARVDVTDALIHHDELVTTIRNSRRHGIVVSGSLDGGLFRHDIDANVATKTWQVHGGHRRAVLCAEWCEKQQLLCSAGSDGRVRLWSLLRSDPQHVLNVGCEPVSIAIHSARDQLLVLTAQHQLKVFDMRSMRCLETMERGGLGPRAAAASGPAGTTGGNPARPPEGTRHGVVHYDSTTHSVVTVIDRPIRLQDVGAAQAAVAATRAMTGGKLSRQKKHVAAHASSVVALVWNGTGKTLFSACRDSLSAWDMGNGEHIFASEVSKQLGTVPGGATSSPVVQVGTRKAQSVLFTLMANGDFITWNPLNGHVLEYLRASLWAPPRSSLPPGAEFSAILDTRSHTVIACGPTVFLLPANRAELLRRRTQHLEREASHEASAGTDAPKSARKPPANTSVPMAPSGPNTSRSAVAASHKPGADTAAVAAYTPFVTTFTAPSNVTSLVACKGETVAAGTISGMVMVYNATTGKSYTIGLPGSPEYDGSDPSIDAAAFTAGLGESPAAVEAVCWSDKDNRGLLLCLQSGGRVSLFHTSTRTLLGGFMLKAPGDNAQFISATLSADEGYLAVGDTLGRINVVDVFNAHLLRAEEPAEAASPVACVDAPPSPSRKSPGRGVPPEALQPANFASFLGGGPDDSFLASSARRRSVSPAALSMATDGSPRAGIPAPPPGRRKPRITVAQGKYSVTRQVPLKAGEAPALVNLHRKEVSPATEMIPISPRHVQSKNGTPGPRATPQGSAPASPKRNRASPAEPRKPAPPHDNIGNGTKLDAGGTASAFSDSVADMLNACPLRVEHVTSFAACDEGISAIVHIPDQGCFVSSGFDGTIRAWRLDRRVPTFLAEFQAGARPQTSQERRWAALAHFRGAQGRPTIQAPDADAAAKSSTGGGLKLRRRSSVGGLNGSVGTFLTEGGGDLTDRRRSVAVPSIPLPPPMPIDALEVTARRLNRHAAQGPDDVKGSAVATEESADERRRHELALQLALFRERQSAKASTAAVGIGWASRATSNLEVQRLADVAPSTLARKPRATDPDARLRDIGL